MELQFKKLSCLQTECITDKYDFYISEYNSKTKVIIEVFNHNIENPDEAFIEAIGCDSVEDAKKAINFYYDKNGIGRKIKK